MTLTSPPPDSRRRRDQRSDVASRLERVLLPLFGGTLARAYVTGEIDVEGDLLDGFRRVWRAARDPGASPRLTAGTLATALRTSTTCPTTSTR